MSDYTLDNGKLVYPGDTALIRGTVKRAVPGVGLLIELFSKTDQYDAWIAVDHVVDVIAEATDLPDEPPDDTFLHVDGSVDHERTVLHRNDSEALDQEGDRRYIRRWHDFDRGEYVDWPTAVQRGAGTGRRLA